ncbi:MAG: UvrD-helicase domain-containing protein, partial [Clostridia bacterium]|nr:UvrD-helicase domain-containing protein [Clostridia bacterium]
LTERILRYVSDPDTPGSLSRLIVVTFTRAAAAELRDRIRAELEAELESNPTEHLTHEILSIAGARISTIHSFCYDLIRAEGEKLGISRNVRLVDDIEDRRLMLDTMEAVLRERCKASKKFSALTESLVGYRKDSLLAKFLVELYDKLMALPEGVEFIKKCAEDEKTAAEDDFLRSACGKSLALTLKKKLAEYIALLEGCLDKLPDDHPYIPHLSCEKENLKAFMLSLDLSYKNAREAHKLASEFSTLRSSSKFKEYEAEASATKYVRDSYKLFIKSLDPLFAQNEEQAHESALEHSELLCELYCTEKQFEAAIFEAKKKEEICSFTDLEQLSIKLLYDENGDLTELARSVSACFDCVFIDEYQDVNNTQRMIFDAISSSCKCFRVGDIKQSIYAFRGADPSIIDKLRAKYDADALGELENVFMSNNFRSKKEILDYINEVFEPHFRGGDFSYEDRDMLIGVEDGENTDTVPRVTVIACKNGKIKENTVSVTEPAVVADEIERLVKEEKLSNGNKIKYGDICILLRNYSTHNEAFVREFKKRGIPYSLQGKRKVFNEIHVRYFLSVLQCADNPTKDIPLATVLFSSLMHFNENDLLTVQQHGRESLWKNLSVAAEKLGGKFAEAYKKISAWRSYARRVTCDTFVRYLLNEEGIRSLLINEAKTDAEKNNVAFDLDIIYSKSLAFKNEARADFSAFVEEIEELAETNTEIEASASKSNDAVSIMSAHASKGLEFPVCFVSRCNANRKHADESRIAFNTDVGIGMYLTDPRGFVLINTPTREAIKLINEQKDAGEEERILYVEFTRAKERLYITADSVPEDTFSAAEAEGALAGAHLPWKMSSVRAAIRAAMSPRTNARLVTVNPVDKSTACIAEAA